ncbi:hypothetical protein ET445_09455 [Agromyces protaetiae]|uniref:Cation efflux protein transmembrane domain-containing protein n=1 Tax=Agromyces protaetiae TaxID=2509455 RepID=A0A4P6FBA9_9MICO|nr:cation transporter [Agromyces protaetiae]QAY73530.1 hypothetical protein ET445_09455 [Agromyces protaetiae]
MATEADDLSGSASDRAAARERRALRLSIVVSLGFVVVALVWGLLAQSQAILLDAIFTPVALLMTWASMRVSGVVAKGPTRRYPFGRTALIPSSCSCRRSSWSARSRTSSSRRCA